MSTFDVEMKELEANGQHAEHMTEIITAAYPLKMKSGQSCFHRLHSISTCGHLSGYIMMYFILHGEEVHH